MLIFHEINLENLNVHEPLDYVGVLDEVDNRLIEREFFANFGPDADKSDLYMIIETFSERNRPKRVRCQVRNVEFWVNLPG